MTRVFWSLSRRESHTAYGHPAGRRWHLRALVISLRRIEVEVSNQEAGFTLDLRHEAEPALASCPRANLPASDSWSGG
jgi:hypothetical protein